MTQIVIDAATLQRLRALQDPAELVDGEGHVVGRFLPAAALNLEPRVSDEELSRREAQGGGRSLQEILGYLEKRA